MWTNIFIAFGVFIVAFVLGILYVMYGILVTASKGAIKYSFLTFLWNLIVTLWKHIRGTLK